MEKRRNCFFLLFSTIFCYLLLDFSVKTGTRFSLRDKQLFEISEVQIARVHCMSKYAVTSVDKNISRHIFVLFLHENISCGYSLEVFLMWKFLYESISCVYSLEIFLMWEFLSENISCKHSLEVFLMCKFLYENISCEYSLEASPCMETLLTSIHTLCSQKI